LTNQYRVILVSLEIGREVAPPLEELALLAESAGCTVVAEIQGRRAVPDAALFVGSGKAEEIAVALEQHQAELVIFDNPLSPAQQRNLERLLKARVIDRTALILDIFAQRAQSHEGKLQVELARLQHQATRLVRAWTHLERQKGGIGLRGGAGESQLEMDKRMLTERIKRLREKLKKLQRQRSTQRRARMRRGQFTVSLVGYTNAGKSTLFNALTHAQAYAADQLFATLDTTVRRIYLPPVGQITVSDTVGFIRDLPHTLVAAFRATLEETIDADLLLHVVDASSPQRFEQIEQVNLVLEEIGAQAIPQILVWNKIDLTDMTAQSERDDCDNIHRIFVSARTGAGLEQLRAALTEIALSSRPLAENDIDTSDPMLELSESGTESPSTV